MTGFDANSFNETEYKALLERLEVSEVWLSELEFSFRLDSEYYQKKFLGFENTIKSQKHSKLQEFANYLIGPFGSAFDTENYILEGKYRYVRGQDVKPFILKDEEKKYIPDDDFLRLSKYALKERDILVSVVGTLGNACIVQKKDLPAIFSCKSTVIRTKDINPTYLLSYLNCEYGKTLLLRKERGAIQKGLNLDDLKTVLIPLFSNEFQNKIEKLFYKAQDKLEESKALYTSAEQLLLKELGLEEVTNIPLFKEVEYLSNHNIKSFKDSFLATGRLDAEYYQKKYEELEKKIKEYKNKSFLKLKDVCNLLDNNFLPQNDTIYSYIELSDIGSSGEIISCMQETGKNLPTRARRLVNKGDVIISSIEGSLSKCALVTEDYDKALCSTGFYVINSKTINSETLLVLLKTKLMQSLMKKICSGTILTSMNKNEFLEIPIPLLDFNIQTKISSKIQESFYLRTESDRLLALAKEMVEVAIEKGEAEALQQNGEDSEGIKAIDNHQDK